MILGTANFMHEYRGYKLDKEKCFEFLNIAWENGIDTVDTYYGYGKSYETICEYINDTGRKFKIINKLENIHEYKDDRNQYALLARNDDPEVIEFIKYLKKNGQIKKTGQAIYYPHEIIPGLDIIQIPNHDLFWNYLDLMQVHSEVHCRSVFQLPGVLWKRCNEVIISANTTEQLIDNIRSFKK